MNYSSNWAPVFDADTRPLDKASFKDLANVGAQLNTYGLHAKDKLTFDKGVTVDTVEIVKQAPRNNNARPSYLVACYINGAKTWINPMFFLRNKRENNQNSPVYPEWAALGDAQAVIAQLIKQGGITAGEDMQVPMADFERDGTAKYAPVVDENGKPKLKADGSVETVRATVLRTYPALPNPVKD